MIAASREGALEDIIEGCSECGGNVRIIQVTGRFRICLTWREALSVPTVIELEGKLYSQNGTQQLLEQIRTLRNSLYEEAGTGLPLGTINSLSGPMQR